MKLENKNLKPNQIVWICDYRHDDIFKKPIRSVPPTEVIVVSNQDNLPRNKRIYYSDTHFRTLKNGKPTSKIIAPCDNTGYRMKSGTFVNIFDNKEECIQCYHEQCEKVLTQIFDGRREATRRFDDMIEVVKEKVDYAMKV